MRPFHSTLALPSFCFQIWGSSWLWWNNGVLLPQFLFFICASKLVPLVVILNFNSTCKHLLRLHFHVVYGYMDLWHKLVDQRINEKKEKSQISCRSKKQPWVCLRLSWNHPKQHAYYQCCYFWFGNSNHNQLRIGMLFVPLLQLQLILEHTNVQNNNRCKEEYRLPLLRDNYSFHQHHRILLKKLVNIQVVILILHDSRIRNNNNNNEHYQINKASAKWWIPSCHNHQHIQTVIPWWISIAT